MTERSFTDPQPKWFEDFEPGDTMTTRGRTVDIGDITTFAGLTGDHYQLHTDGAFMENSRFGQRIAHGPLTFSIAVGLIGLSGFYGDAIVALIEEDEDIALLVLAAGTGKDGPGPLVSTLAGKVSGSFAIPIAIVPGHLSDDEIDALA